MFLTLTLDENVARTGRIRAITCGASLRIAGDWGNMEASTGVLVSADRATRTLPVPFRTEGRTLIGDGWTLTLASGWVVRSGPRPSDSQVVRDDR